MNEVEVTAPVPELDPQHTRVDVVIDAGVMRDRDTAEPFAGLRVGDFWVGFDPFWEPAPAWSARPRRGFALVAAGSVLLHCFK